MELDLWEPFFDAASKAMGAAAIVGTAVHHARRAIAQLDPATTQLRELRKAFPRVVDACSVQLHHAHGPLRESFGRNFPVDDLRAELVAPGLSTADKVSLWNRVVRARLGSLVAGCAAAAGLATVALVEVTTQLVKKAKADEAQSATGSFVSNAILAQLQRSGAGGLPVSGGAFSTPGPHLASLIGRLDEICAASAAALDETLPADFSCKSAVSARQLAQWLAAALASVTNGCHGATWASLVTLHADADPSFGLDPLAAMMGGGGMFGGLPGLPSSPASPTTSDPDWVASVARDASFVTVVSAHAAGLLADYVTVALPQVVARCPSFKSDADDGAGAAAMVQIAPGLAHVFSALLEADTIVPPATVRFCEAIFTANTQSPSVN